MQLSPPKPFVRAPQNVITVPILQATPSLLYAMGVETTNTVQIAGNAPSCILSWPKMQLETGIYKMEAGPRSQRRQNHVLLS
jgi:hypothetical protein